MSVTDRCDLQCRYCRPQAEQSRQDFELTDEQRIRFLRMLVGRCGLRQVRFTGGEPLLHPTLAGLIAAARRLSPGLQIAITTNGQRLHDLVPTLRRAGLDRLNVSLDTLDADRYHDLTRGDLAAVHRGLRTARRAGLHPIRVNAVVLAGVNDEELPNMVRWAGSRSIQLRFLEAMPIGPAADFNRKHFVSAAQILERLGRDFRVLDAGRSTGSTAHQYRLAGRRGETEIGIIAPVSRPFCGDCRRMRLTADGRLFPCLLDSRCIALRPLLAGVEDDDAVCAALAAGIAGKAAAGSVQHVQMVQLGG